MLNKIKNRKQEGFTIIEVLIVLAIAALIMLIVFLAIPQLQRNNRNTARRNEAGRYAAAANEFLSNNSGKLPTVDDATDIAALKAAVGDVKYYTGSPEIKAGAQDPYTADDSVRIVIKATCDGTKTADGSDRQMAVQYGLEPNVAACQNV